jgi:ribosomal protein S18 acetylase RimI-like enzyme
MQAKDVKNVVYVQEKSYIPSLYERQSLYLAIQQHYPQGCWVAYNTYGSVAGYMIAYPVLENEPPPLDTAVIYPLHECRALHLHDMAIHPDWRGLGLTKMLMQQYERLLSKSHFALASLIAVQNTKIFWEKYGFRVSSDNKDLSSYGDDAYYMIKSKAYNE